MPVTSSEDAEHRALKTIADLMAVAARTAPKTRGVDKVVTAILDGAEKDAVADEMDRVWKMKRSPLAFFARDAANVRDSPILLLIGVQGTVPKKPEIPFNCGACGYATCGEFMSAEKRMGEDFMGAVCVWHAVDLGVALGSAVKTASMFNADNRILYSAGVAVKSLGLVDADVVVAVPLSASGKNIFFDRG